MADFGRGRWRGALLRGPSGAGKSTLALRCMAGGFRLAADDRVVVWRSGGRLFGKAPPVLSGLIEVRGAGVLPTRVTLSMAEIVLIADLSARPERMPEPPTDTLLGLVLPRIALDPEEASAPLRLRAALAASQHGL